MCITSGHARLTGTKILSLNSERAGVDTGKNFLMYENTAVNLSGKPNCMILPVPGNMTKEDFIDGTPYKGFLSQMVDLFFAPERSRGSRGMMLGLDKGVEHFKSGQYDVFLAHPMLTGSMVDSITDALNDLPMEMRPQISPQLLEWYEHSYPSWTLLLCVFAADKPMEAQPIMFTYTPFLAWTYRLFFPGVDSHTGGVPDLDRRVPVDHYLFTEHQTDSQRIFMFPPAKPETARYRRDVPIQVMGRTFIGEQFSGSRMNGDWAFRRDEGFFTRGTPYEIHA